MSKSDEKLTRSTLPLVAFTAICVAVVLCLGLFAYQSLLNLSESTEVVAEAEHERLQLAQLLETLVRMGGGIRQYQSSQDVGAFDDAKAATAKFPADLEMLTERLSVDAIQRPLLAQLRDLAAQRLAQTARLRDLSLSGDNHGVNTLVATGEGARIMDACRALVAKMQARQTQRFQDRLGLAANAREMVAIAISVTTALATMLLVLVAYVTMRHAIRLREANSTLEQRVVERTARLMAQEAVIRTFYEHSSECHAVLAVAEDGRFRYEEVNPAVLRLYAKQREEVIGHTIEEVFDSKTAAILNTYLTACLSLDAPFRYERVHNEETIEAIATPVPHEVDGQRRILVSARDVSERRRLEQQLLQSQKMEAVGQLTGGLAHDFNNLLSGISGSFELLQTRVAQGRVTDIDRFVKAGQAAARRAAALTHRLLAFSRRQTLDSKPTDVNRLIAGIVELISRTVGPEIDVGVIGAMGLWHPSVDANQLENALLNLCINARDAMPSGGKITIETANRWIDARLGTERELAPGQYISICVSDTGSGMTPEVVSRAFDPFFTTKPLGQGTGLGLSMIYGFARQSGGQVRIYSEVGQGTMVCIYLPRAQGEAEPEAVPAEVPTLKTANQGETVLVVDDEPVVRMLVTEVLQDLGYAAIECEDGVAALKVLESPRRIDLMITDVGLPNGINGRQLADAGAALRPSLKILFITGYAENAVMRHGHLDPPFHLVTKPFAMSTLADRIALLMRSNAKDTPTDA